MTDDPPLTLQEAADRLRVHRRTCEGYIAQGLLKASKPAGRWIIRSSAVEKFLNGDVPDRATA